MSDQTIPRLNLAEHIARIDRALDEAEMFRAEQRKRIAEMQKVTNTGSVGADLGRASGALSSHRRSNWRPSGPREFYRICHGTLACGRVLNPAGMRWTGLAKCGPGAAWPAGETLMPLMLSKLYEALCAGNTSDDKALEAAEEVATYENRMGKLEPDLILLKWMVGVRIALTAAVLAKLTL
jgi:hypothetical protein